MDILHLQNLCTFQANLLLPWEYPDGCACWELQSSLVDLDKLTCRVLQRESHLFLV